MPTSSLPTVFEWNHQIARISNQNAIDRDRILSRGMTRHSGQEVLQAYNTAPVAVDPILALCDFVFDLHPP
jgi:hypothetical protein